MKRNIKRNISLLIVILFLSIILSSCSGNKGDRTKIDFRYANKVGTDSTSTIYYSDEYFKSDASKYNASLSTCSIGLAMSSFMSNEAKKSTDYTNRYKNVSSLLNNMGFMDVEANKDAKEKPTTDTLGVCFGRRVIQEEGYTIIAAGIRDTGYSQELSNSFYVGTNEETLTSAGFTLGAEAYIESLVEYIKNKNISGNIKLWSVGFSSAGAINNLAMAKLDRSIRDNEHLLGEQIIINHNDIYGYCFEDMMGANWYEETNPRDELYNNIHNVINPNDPVTMLISSLFGFTRYGVDHVLFQSGLDEDYHDHIAQVKNMYSKFEYAEDFVIDTFRAMGIENIKIGPLNEILSDDHTKVNWTSQAYVSNFLDLFSETLGSREYYVENMQEGLRTVFEMLFRSTSIKFSLQNLAINIVKSLLSNGEIDYLVSALLREPLYFMKDILATLKTALMIYGITENINDVINSFKSVITSLTKTLFKNLSFVFTILYTSNIKAILQAHYPEITMAYLMAEDINYTNNPNTYDSTGEYIYIEIPYNFEDITIYDSNDNIVCGCGSLYDVDIYSSYTYGINQNNFVCYLPKGNYRIVCNTTNYLVGLKDPSQRDLIPLDLQETDNGILVNYNN